MKIMISEYPYGQFPTRFTKNGQKAQLEKIENSKTEALSIDPPSEQQNTFDLSKLLPLIKLMGNKKSISNADMLQLVVPLLGGNSSNVSDIISLLTPSATDDGVVEDVPTSTLSHIDEYKRVE